MHKFTLTTFLLILLLAGVGCTTKNNVPGNNRPVLVATVIPTPAAAAGLSPAELLATGDFAFYRYGAELWAVNLNGGQPVELRLQPAADLDSVLRQSHFLLGNALVTPDGAYFNLSRSGRCTPLLAPDKRQGACADWTIEANSKLQVWLVDMADGATTPLYEGTASLGGQPSPLRWSADGERLAFADNAVVKVADTAALTVTTVADLSALDRRAEMVGWAGERLLVEVDDNLVILDLAGDNPPETIFQADRLRLQGWSPQHQQGLFSTESDLLLVDTATNQARSIHQISEGDHVGGGKVPKHRNAGGAVGPAVWSPDGSRIVLRYVWAESESTPARDGWLLIEAQTGAVTPLPVAGFETRSDGLVRWSPAGEALISPGPSPNARCRTDCDPGLYRIDIASGEAEVLAERMGGDTLVIISGGEAQ